MFYALIRIQISPGNSGNVKLLSRVRLFATPWAVAYQTPPSMEFSKQEYWIAISFSRRSSQPRDWIRASSIVGRRFTVWATREVQIQEMEQPNSRVECNSAKKKSLDLFG